MPLQDTSDHFTSLHYNSTHQELIRLNFVAKWVAPMACIQEVLGSNPSPETNYPDWILSLFSVSPDKYQYRSSNYAMIITFQFIIH
jgi:hypothetical protein